MIVEKATTKIHPISEPSKNVKVNDEEGNPLFKKYSNIRCTPTGVSAI